jgi:hypothetical protein
MSIEIQRHYLLNIKLKHNYLVNIKVTENKLKFLSILAEFFIREFFNLFRWTSFKGKRSAVLYFRFHKHKVRVRYIIGCDNAHGLFHGLFHQYFLYLKCWSYLTEWSSFVTLRIITFCSKNVSVSSSFVIVSQEKSSTYSLTSRALHNLKIRFSYYHTAT